MPISFTNLVHILFVGPLLIYTGYFIPTYPAIYILLILLGCAIFGRFVYSLATTPRSQRHVWFGLHALVFAPLLIYVGIMRTSAAKVTFSLLLAIGIAAFGYHTVRLLSSLIRA